MEIELKLTVDVPKGINAMDIIEWINAHLDNIPTEMLEEYGVDSELVEEVGTPSVMPF